MLLWSPTRLLLLLVYTYTWAGGEEPVGSADYLPNGQRILAGKENALVAKGQVASIHVAAPTDQYRLTLKELYSSHGTFVPDFSPNITDYQLVLDFPVDRIALTPEIDQGFVEYQGVSNMPVVKIMWKNHEDPRAEAAAIAVRKMIDLPDDGTDLKVAISVQNPNKLKEKMNYNVLVKQSGAPKSILKMLDAVDDNGNGVTIAPIVSEDSPVYSLYVRPDATFIRIQPTCTTGSWVSLDGKKVSNGAKVKVWREKTHHKQVYELTCGKGSMFGTSSASNYIVQIMSDFPQDQIMKPRLVFENSGRDCSFDEKKQEYQCPEPHDKRKKARITGFIEPSIRYTIESPNKEVEVRVLSGLPTIPFSYRSDLELVARSGQCQVRWPLKFAGNGAPGMVRFIGWLMAGLLAVLLLTSLTVIGTANICGIGVPFGTTEIAATLTLLLQYLNFANFLRGSSLLTQMTEVLRWVTLFWPLPWRSDVDRSKTRNLYEGAPSRGVQLWGDALLGDVTDVRNACGCLFWSSLIFALCVIIHMIVIIIFKIFQRKHTFPHRLRFGNWESRCLHWLAFPVSTASGMIILHPNTTSTWKALGAGALSVLGVWVMSVWFVVMRNVATKRVCWVWNSSVREDGELEDESGYWCDTVCDQLQTHPVNRSLCAWFFPFRWVSTVADVEPVDIHPHMYKRRGENVYAPQEYGHSHNQGSVPQAKTPKTVEVVRTRKSVRFCPVQRLIAGLLRTHWLDILFTYQALSKFYTESVKDRKELIIPLTVKTHQLNGPIAAGSNAFFFEGVRVPFARICDTAFRMVLGIFVGCALASTRHSVDATMFGLICVVVLGCLGYVAASSPYTRQFENWLVGGVLLAIGLSALSFLLYAATKKDPSTVADICLWFVALVCVTLSAYSCIVTFSVVSALICPPLDESRFLEKLANCNVTISDHNMGWAVDVPAYTKYGARSLKASCGGAGRTRAHVSMYPSGEEPTLEFTLRDLQHACKTGTLQGPTACVFAPANEDVLGYRHTNIYDRNSLAHEMTRFLAGDSATRHWADEAGREIAHQVDTRGKGRTILSITILPAYNRSENRERYSVHAKAQ